MMAIFMAIIGGPLLAWVFTQPFGRKAFDKRKVAFAELGGRDPEQDIVGPHRSFTHNLVAGALLMGAIGAAATIGARLAAGG